MSEEKRQMTWWELLQRVGRWVAAVAVIVWRDLRAWARLQWQVAQVERRIRRLAEDRDEALKDLGRAVMARFGAGRMGDPELASHCTEIQVIEREIESQRGEKARLRGLAPLATGALPAAQKPSPAPVALPPAGEEDLEFRPQPSSEPQGLAGEGF